jgi:hypothetical protein
MDYLIRFSKYLEELSGLTNMLTAIGTLSAVWVLAQRR